MRQCCCTVYTDFSCHCLTPDFSHRPPTPALFLPANNNRADFGAGNCRNEPSGHPGPGTSAVRSSGPQDRVSVSERGGARSHHADTFAQDERPVSEHRAGQDCSGVATSLETWKCQCIRLRSWKRSKVKEFV